jgi:hypothetical protein
LAEVEVNIDVAFGEGTLPETIGDLRERDTLFDWPKAAGAIFHEALHARYSRFSLEKATEVLSRNEYNALMSLEESRIEYHGVENFPNNRVFLRACALEIVLHDINASADEHLAHGVRAVAGLAALTCARADAGSLDHGDVEEIKTIVLEFLGEEVYAGLRSIWLRFQAHDSHTDPTALYELAREWEKLLADLATERGEPETPTPGGAGSDILILVDGIINEIKEALEEAAGDVAIASNDEVQDQEQKEEWKQVVDMRSQASKQQKEHKQVANDVFGKTTSEMGETRGSRSRLDQIREPLPTERAAAVKIANMLERAKYREREENEISSILPPGRLRTRAMVQEAAYKAQGSMQHAEPWKRTVRKHTDDPTLKIGVMVDISGSMASAMQPMAVTAWAMSEAGRRVQAKTAMVYYGEDVFPTLKPGQHLDKVNVYTAPDGTEKFDKAFKGLDGALNLLYGNGARLLVIVSDGCYTDTETERAKFWVRECDKAGVAVLWLPFDRHGRSGYADRITAGTSTVVLSNVNDPAEAAVTIGKAAADALGKIGRKNAA